jgi:hypothetical protein
MTSDPPRSRRRVLQLAGAGTIGTLTGCFGFLSGSEPTVIDKITFDRETVVVHLTDETSVDAIDLRSPSDELLNTVRVGRQSTVEFGLYAGTDTPYPPGTYTLVAVETNENGESHQLSTRTIDLTLSMEITDVQTVTDAFGASVPAKIRVTVKNTGRLPIKIAYLGVPAGVPSPDSPPAKADSPIAGFLSTSNTGQLAPVGTKTTFETRGSPLRYDGTVEPGGVKEPPREASWDQLSGTTAPGPNIKPRSSSSRNTGSPTDAK